MKNHSFSIEKEVLFKSIKAWFLYPSSYQWQEKGKYNDIKGQCLQQDQLTFPSVKKGKQKKYYPESKLYGWVHINQILS